MDKKDLKNLAEIRKKIFKTGYSGGMAHLASCFSAVEIIYTLYMKGVMNYDAKNPNWENRDRFILSKGHGGLALYTILSMAGFFDEKLLETYLQPNCYIGGEPNIGDIPGIEASTGSLGHGISFAIGTALGQKIDKKNAKTYVLIGDGESQEGTIWEAAMSAASFELDNLVVILDCNEVQKTGRVEDVMGEPAWRKKWEAFGWNVVEVDGHNVDAIKKVLMSVKQEGRPTLVISHTIKGKGVSIMENNPIWHYKLPNKKEKKVFIKELGMEEMEI